MFGFWSLWFWGHCACCYGLSGEFHHQRVARSHYRKILVQVQKMRQYHQEWISCFFWMWTEVQGKFASHGARIIIDGFSPIPTIVSDTLLASYSCMRENAHCEGTHTWGLTHTRGLTHASGGNLHKRASRCRVSVDYVCTLIIKVFFHCCLCFFTASCALFSCFKISHNPAETKSKLIYAAGQMTLRWGQCIKKQTMKKFKWWDERVHNQH